MAETTNDTKVTSYIDVVHSKDTKRIVLPENMTEKEAIVALERKRAEQNEWVKIHEPTTAYPLDGALAMMKAIAEQYGWANLRPTPGFFGPNPPTMVAVSISPSEKVQVPWGRIEIPGIEGHLQTGIYEVKGRPAFVIGGEVRRKNERAIATLAARVREIVAEESIYRAKAIKINFGTFDSIEDYNPTFMDLSQVDPSQLILSADVMDAVNTSVFTPIERTELCRTHKIPLKRGVCLAGPYGTGKTLTARVTAYKAVTNGWTYIYLENVDDLDKAISFAKMYQPAVIFAEDIDQALGSQKRTKDENAVLNTIDGIDSKADEIMVILTTNHVEKLSKAMLRPGRLDAVIAVQPPDRDAVKQLIRLYACDMLAKDANLESVADLLAGEIPATIREVVERSKMAAIATATNGRLALTDRALEIAARGMRSHLELLKPQPVDTRSDIEKAATELALVVKGVETDGVRVTEAIKKHRSMAPSVLNS
jgi:transitional endoplasmic reticulum ATPase